MSRSACPPSTDPTARRASTLVELLVATMITGVLLLAAMQTVGGSVRAGMSSADRSLGLWLAQELMSEILVADYAEPDDVPTLGPEPSEIDGTRAAFDDVDDYHNWDASPPQNRDGSEIPDRNGWQRTVVVEYVNAHDLTTVVAADQGVKRVRVTVIRNGTTLAQLTSVRTDAD